MLRNSTVICQTYCTSLMQDHDTNVSLEGSWLADLTPLLPMSLVEHHHARSEQHCGPPCGR